MLPKNEICILNREIDIVRTPVKICHVAAEIAPIAKIGGLGDVVYGLARDTARRGHELAVVLPKYDILLEEDIAGLERLPGVFDVEFQSAVWSNTVWKGAVSGLQLFFIEPHHTSHYFNRGCIYGCDDDVERFLYFSKAASEFVRKELQPDVLHIHDWQTAIMAILARENSNAKILLTLHNLDYQGRCSPYELEKIGLDVAAYYNAGSMQDPVYPEALNLLLGGIRHADFVTTVSPTYAQEVQHSFLGNGLESIIKENAAKFRGILNGIDYEYWNPETDPLLPAHFGPRESSDAQKNQPTIASKGYVKRALRQHLLLEEAHRPIVGVICRLVPQKGVDLIRYAIEAVLEKGGQFVLLGSSPIPAINEEFYALKRRYGENPNVGIALQHKEVLAHLIYAGSDIFIVPSNFEPCGLTQMIALRYGTIPLVRQTGGLQDTIFDHDYGEPSPSKAQGYTFKDPTTEAFDAALTRAMSCWKHYHNVWRKIVLEGMEHDFSWKKPGEEYLKIYQGML